MAVIPVHLVELSLLEEHRYSPTLGYLHAALAAARDVAARVEVRKHISPATAEGQAALLEAVLPDDPEARFVVAFTVYFWNRPQTMAAAELIKAARPNAVIVVGGNDVTHQQDAVFAETPAVDVLVHGEGELRFVELCRNLVNGRDPIEEVLGVSAVRDGSVLTTPAAPRITELDSIPSPLLDPVYDDADLAGTRMIIYETNRGCPYTCAFCFWGGATNAKVRQFSLERITAELDRIVRAAAPNAHLFVADANFGILRRDLDIARIFVDLCEKYDKRIVFMTNWAKNSNSKVVEIAEVLYDRGLLPAVTLSAQSFDSHTLQLAQRGNIKSERYDTLLVEFRDRGIPTYTDLIWGLPGESLGTHLAGIERVLQAGGCPVVWPLLLLNNTEYASDTFGAQHPLIVERRPGDVSNPDLVADVVLGHPDLTEAEWRHGNLHAASTGVFAKVSMRCTLRYLSHVGSVRIVDLVDAII
ncbi:MAG: radical SAM protein, partial [Herbiconiux sp.]|nr:radical SAM protein [Herbiconiux sp.]